MNFQILKYLADLNEPWYGLYAVAGHTSTVLSFKNVRKIVNSGYQVSQFCLSARPPPVTYGTTRLRLDGFL